MLEALGGVSFTCHKEVAIVN